MLYLSKYKIPINISYEQLNKLPCIEHTDYDLNTGLEAVALKSNDGHIHSFYRTSFPEMPEDFINTKLCTYSAINNYMQELKVEKCRVRIHKLPAQKHVKIHTDDQNDNYIGKSYRMRVITAINDDKDFIYHWKYNNQSISCSLEKGQSIIFDPDKVAHGSNNLTLDKIRYTIISIIVPNKWLVSEFLGERLL